MGKWTGTFTAFGDDFNLTEYTESLTDVVLADDRISMDWGDDEKLGAILRVHDVDGHEIWRGNITSEGTGAKRGELWGVRYDLRDGGAILIVRWEEDDYSGSGLYEILPK